LGGAVGILAAAHMAVQSRHATGIAQKKGLLRIAQSGRTGFKR
jgi:hypothetical protein